MGGGVGGGGGAVKVRGVLGPDGGWGGAVEGGSPPLLDGPPSLYSTLPSLPPLRGHGRKEINVFYFPILYL